MIEAEQLRLHLGDRPLFNDVSFRIGAGQRVCVAGRNGQGKSTLMKVIMGLASVEKGTVNVSKGRTIGYLPQDMPEEAAPRTVVEEVLTAIGDLAKLEREIEELATEISLHPEDASLLERYGKAQARFEAMDGYGVDAKARTILHGLGFSQERMDSKLGTLSGGWRMRVHLAKLLLTRPDALLLDEPTNHLDLESREWLLTFLSGYEGALIITSHDRYFLDHLVTKVFELEMGELTIYSGNYSRFEIQRAERIEHLKKEYARQQRELKRQQEFIDRNRAKAATASNVQSRIKQLAKIERVELPYEPPTLKLRFPEPERGGQLAFRLHGLGKSYGEHKVFGGLDLELPAGEKLAVVGVNGAGKTTLLKLLSERLDASEGRVELGHEVEIQYFSQYEDHLPDSQYSLLQAMQEASPPEPTVPHRTILGCFLFSGDDVHKPIRVLSGGERARLKLARMLLQPSNLLVMDEPTNHLDLHSKGILLDALRNFGGTVVFVSHDRGFLADLATSVLEITDGEARFYPCDYEQYRWRLERDKQAAQESEKAKSEKAKSEKAKSEKAKSKPKPQQGKSNRESKGELSKSQRIAQRRAGKEARKALKRLRRKAEEAQAEVEAKEARLAELEGLMSEPGFFDDPEQSTPVVTEHKHLQVEIEMGYQAFEEALERVERAEAEVEAAS